MTVSFVIVNYELISGITHPLIHLQSSQLA